MKNIQFVLIFRGIPRAGKTTLAKRIFKFLKDTLLKFYKSLNKNIKPHSIIIDTQKLSEDDAFNLIIKDLEEYGFI